MSATTGPVAMLFDFDGTLIDSYPAITASVNHVRSLHQLPPLSVAEVTPHVGRGPAHLLACTVGIGESAANVEAYRAHHPTIMGELTQLLPGAAEVLRGLKQRGLATGICSNKPAAFTRELVVTLGIASWLDLLLGPEDVGRHKPAPDMLIVAMRRLGVEAARTVYVGDMTVDVETARGAGVRVWVVPTGSDTAEALDVPGPTGAWGDWERYSSCWDEVPLGGTTRYNGGDVADHDQRLKQTIQSFLPEFAALILPAGWAGRFTFASAQWLPQEVFLDPPEGERRVLDLLARVPVTQAIGAANEALLHVEIESGDSAANLRARMPRYRSGLRARYTLPILSLTIYFDVALEGVGWDETSEEIWDEQMDRVRWRYLGLSGLEAERYVEGENLLGVALSALMRVDEGRRPWLKARAIERIAQAKLPQQHQRWLVEIVEAYLPLVGPHRDEYERLLKTEDFTMARQLGMTTREEGEESGFLKSEKGYTREVLEARFGKLSEATLARLNAWPPDRLREIGRGVVQGKSLVELGLEDPPVTNP